MELDLDKITTFIYNSNRIENINYPFETTKSIIEDWQKEESLYEKALFENSFPEIINHYKALEYVLKSSEERRPDIIDIMDAHNLLMRKLIMNAGQFRTVQVYVGNHVPPAPGRPLIEAVQNFAEWLKNSLPLESNLFYPEFNRDLYRLCYEAHCKFEEVHPFIDGNGRVGRLFWLGLLNYYGHSGGFNYIDFEDREDYYRSLEQRQDKVTENLWYPPQKGN